MLTRNNFITIFLSLILLIPLLNISPLIYQQKNSQNIPPLLSSTSENFLSTEYGIYTENIPSFIDSSISELVDEQPVYYPGSTIKFRNRFTIPSSGGYAIVDHNVSIFLNKQSDLNQINPAHFITNTTTNGTDQDEYPPLSDDPSEGYIDTSIVIPSLSDLSTIYGITPGDTATIYQWLDPSNTRFVESIDPIYFADNFTVSGYSQISAVGGFVNPASGDNTFRQGENASVTLKATSASDNVPNVEVDISLHYSSNNATILNGTNGINYYLRDVSSKNPSKITDGNGELELIVNTTLPNTPEDTFFFNVTGNFSATPYFTQNYDQDVPGSNYAVSTVEFIVENEMDTISLILDSISEDPLEPPNVNVTIVTYQVNILYAYGGTYYLPNLPVNASLDSYPNGVVLSSDFSNNGTPGWFLTNSTGYIAFKITATFPILFNDIVSTITTTVNLVNNSLPNSPYPLGPPTQPHRYLQSQASNSNETDINSLSINPDFWLGEIGLFSIDTTSIQPGQSAILIFEVNSTQAPAVPFEGVPVEFVINPSIAGVSLSVSGINPYGNFYETDVNGRIQVTVDSIHLTTPEIIKSINIRITVDFENDSQIRWIGDQHAGTDTLANFDITWLEDSFSDLSIDPNFTKYEIVFSTSNESGDTFIRSGDILEVTFKVQSQGVGTGLPGVSVTVNLGESYSDISLVPVGNTSTDLSGLITVRLITTYNVSRKNLPIVLNATADFITDTNPNVWLVGEKSLNPNFFSNSSYSDVVQIITMAPQYFFGEISVALIANNPNATRIGQTEWINITFKLHLTYSGGGSVNPIIDNVNISIQINNQNPSAFNMNVIPGDTYQDSTESYATFYIQPTLSTPEDTVYTINATAYFGNAQALTYNLTHETVPSGELAGVWVNGSHTNDISFSTYEFEVKNIDRIQVQIAGPADITDLSHSDEGFNNVTGFYEVYRETTNINVSGTYVDPLVGPLTSSEQIIISFNYTNVDNETVTYDLGSINTTTGAFSIVIIIPTTIPLQDIEIYGWDPSMPNPQENRDPITNIRLMSSISFNNLGLSGYNGNAIFTGESVTASATMIDDQGATVDSTPFNGLIRVIGWDSTQEVGISTSGSLTGGSYSLSYEIPQNYALNTIFIRSKVLWGVNLVHYRPGFNQTKVNVYRDFSINTLEIDLPGNSTQNIPLVNGNTYYIKGFSHQQVTLTGNLWDLSNRPLQDKDVISYWNASSQTQSTSITDGSFSFTHDFTGYTNVTWVWEFYHTLDNGTTLSTFFTVSFIWEVYDETKPSIIIDLPVGINSTALTQTPLTNISTIISDPSPPSYISVGLNASSVQITIKLNTVIIIQEWMSNVSSTFSYDWDTSSVGDELYFISITARDFAGNLQNNSFYAVFDVVEPFATITTSGVSGYATIDSNGDIQISGTLSDSSSVTDRNSGIDPTSIVIIIQPQGSSATLTLLEASVTVNQTYFSYKWNVFNNVTDERILLFDGEDWEILVTITDNAGNTNQTTILLTLEEDSPIIIITTQPPYLIEEGSFIFSINATDVQTGVNIRSVRFSIYSADDSSLITTYTYLSSEVAVDGIDIFDLTLNVNTFDNGEYYITATILDNMGNSQEIPSINFGIRHITTTVPPTTPPTSIPIQSPLNPLDLIQFLLLDVIALVGGIGIAVFFEKVKARRKG